MNDEAEEMPLTPEELCAVAHISLATLHRLWKAGRGPAGRFFIDGKRLRIDRAEGLRWARDRQRLPVPEPAEHQSAAAA